MNSRVFGAAKATSVTSSFATQSSPQREKVVWAIGGGKGGIGKSFISSSLAIYLAQTSRRVIIIDLDLGGANLHTCLGNDIPSLSLSDFLSGRASSLKDVLVPSQINGLQFISGANDALNIASLDDRAVTTLIEQIRGLNADYVIIDLGAGTTNSTLDFFLSADKSIVAITPEPTSIENAYRFIKSSVYRKMKQVESSVGLTRIVEDAMDHRNRHGIRSPADLIRYVETVDSIAGTQFRTEMEKLHLNLLVNQVRTRSDIDLGGSIQSVCKRYFGIDTDFIGHIDYDNAVWQSLRKKRPLILEYPNSLIVSQLSNITKNLIDPKRARSIL